MTPQEIEAFNAKWLDAWSRKDSVGVSNSYTEDALYMDPQTAESIKGRAAIKEYLDKLFASQPDVVYKPHQVWVADNGNSYTGRWYATISAPEKPIYMRGFDLCIMEGGLIARNEVYVHMIKEIPADAK